MFLDDIPVPVPCSVDLSPEDIENLISIYRDEIVSAGANMVTIRRIQSAFPNHVEYFEGSPQFECFVQSWIDDFKQRLTVG